MITSKQDRSGKVVVDFIKLFEEGDDEQNVFLKRGDVIKIPEKKNYITMLGQLVKPGNIIYDPSLSVDEYIELAGGFGWRAIEGDVRVIKVNTGEWIDADMGARRTTWTKILGCSYEWITNTCPISCNNCSSCSNINKVMQ
jgi:hypothetical protein